MRNKFHMHHSELGVISLLLLSAVIRFGTYKICFPPNWKSYAHLRKAHFTLARENDKDDSFSRVSLTPPIALCFSLSNSGEVSSEIFIRSWNVGTQKCNWSVWIAEIMVKSGKYVVKLCKHVDKCGLVWSAEIISRSSLFITAKIIFQKLNFHERDEEKVKNL